MSKTASTAQQTVRPLRDISEAEQRHAKEVAEASAKLAATRAAALAIQEQFESLRSHRDHLRWQIGRVESGRPVLEAQAREIEDQVEDRLGSAEWGFGELPNEYAYRKFVLDRIPGYLEKRKAELATAEKALTDFAKLHDVKL